MLLKTINDWRASISVGSNATTGGSSSVDNETSKLFGHSEQNSPDASPPYHSSGRRSIVIFIPVEEKLAEMDRVLQQLEYAIANNSIISAKFQLDKLATFLQYAEHHEDFRGIYDSAAIIYKNKLAERISLVPQIFERFDQAVKKHDLSLAKNVLAELDILVAESDDDELINRHATATYVVNICEMIDHMVEHLVDMRQLPPHSRRTTPWIAASKVKELAHMEEKGGGAAIFALITPILKSKFQKADLLPPVLLDKL